MEEMMMVMMNIRSHGTSPIDTIHHHKANNNINIPITTTSTCPTWKLYENPFYVSHIKPHQIQHHTDQVQDCTDQNQNQNQIHRLHLPISTRKIAASFWDLTFIKPFMESEHETGRARIDELKAELECERKARKKMESLNKRLSRELSEERRGREALEKVCEELARELSSNKGEIDRVKKEIEEERKMLRTAEVIREERVQMKLAEAKVYLEEKLWELEICKKSWNASSSSLSSLISKKEVVKDNGVDHPMSFGEKLGFVDSMALIQRKAASSEAENPHIKRGIKGFVEFPKVVRAIGCRSGKHLGTKLECQKAQLKILLKQKGAVRFNGLIAS